MSCMNIGECSRYHTRSAVLSISCRSVPVNYRETFHHSNAPCTTYLEYKESESPDSRTVKRSTDEIRILVWHEFTSTLMISYHGIRDILPGAADECLQEDLSLPLFIQRMVNKFLEAYFSSVIDEKMENFFKPVDIRHEIHSINNI